jgi:MGT family glycosyltransferase
MKGLFFSLPSVSVHKTLMPVIEHLCSDEISMIHYNEQDFATPDNDNLLFKPYPSLYNGGYNTGNIGIHTSYFDFADMLLHSAISIFDFLRAEIEREKPDFIIHSHLALWGKLIAGAYKIPAITFFTTFIMDEGIMIPFLRNQNNGKGQDQLSIQQILGFQRKYKSFLKEQKLSWQPDIWDVYVNSEAMNIAFIDKVFQPSPELLDHRFQFVGHPARLSYGKQHKELIYLSLGTVFSDDIPLFNLCLRVFRQLSFPCLISIGQKVKPSDLDEIPSNVTIVEFLDQEKVLENVSVFITRGGMTSVNEALAAFAPMIVIPQIPEQHLIAAAIDSLGVGKYLSPKALDENLLLTAIHEITENAADYNANMQLLQNNRSVISPAEQAREHILNYLYTVRHGTDPMFAGEITGQSRLTV